MVTLYFLLIFAHISIATHEGEGYNPGSGGCMPLFSQLENEDGMSPFGSNCGNPGGIIRPISGEVPITNVDPETGIGAIFNPVTKKAPFDAKGPITIRSPIEMEPTSEVWPTFGNKPTIGPIISKQQTLGVEPITGVESKIRIPVTDKILVPKTVPTLGMESFPTTGPSFGIKSTIGVDPKPTTGPINTRPTFEVGPIADADPIIGVGPILEGGPVKKPWHGIRPTTGPFREPFRKWPIFEPRPLPIIDPEPIIEPIIEPEPIIDPKPRIDPKPIIDPPIPIIDPEPIIGPKPIIDPIPIDPEPIIGPKPIIDPPKPIIEPGPIVDPIFDKDPASGVELPTDVESTVDIVSLLNAVDKFQKTITELTPKFIGYLVSLYPKQTFGFSALYLVQYLALFTCYSNGNLRKELTDVHKIYNENEIRYVLTHITNVIKTLPSGVNNFVIGDNTIQFTTNFIRTFEEVLMGTVGNADFKNSVRATETINRLVYFATGYKVLDILPSSNYINENTEMVWLTGMYKKPLFEMSFDFEMLVEKSFLVQPRKKVKILYHYQEGTYNYTECPDLKCRILEIPLNNCNYVLQLIAPKSRYGLRGLLKRLENYGAYNAAVQKLQPRLMEFYLPVIDTVSTIDTKILLQKAKLVSCLLRPKQAELNGVVVGNTPMSLSVGLQKVTLRSIKIKAKPNLDLRDQKKMKVDLNSPYAYYVRSNDGTIVSGGVFANNNEDTKICDDPLKDD